MSAEENKAIARRLHESFNTDDETAAGEELLAPDFKAYVPGSPEPLSREAYNQFNRQFSAAFPDGRVTVKDLIAEGDKVVLRMRYQGTHQGDFQGLPPTGKRVTMAGIGIDRIADGQIVEHRAEFDTLGLMQQLGVITAPAQTGVH
jgi:steroid delta-isomerase-like uncharacterized protein